MKAEEQKEPVLSAETLERKIHFILEDIIGGNGKTVACARICKVVEDYAQQLHQQPKVEISDDEIKAYIDTLPYYGTCTNEYNEGFEDGAKWAIDQLRKRGEVVDNQNTENVEGRNDTI